MYNILIISHGNLAREFYNTAEMIAGEVENVKAIGIQPEESPEVFGKRIEAVAEEIYTDDGLLVLADVYGGTPCNIAIMKLLYKYRKVQIVSGLNLPMLLEALGCRNSSLEKITRRLINNGKQSIVDVNKVIEQKLVHGNDE